jgi:hypothetical protein
MTLFVLKLQMRDFLRVVSTNKSTYELKYYNIQVLTCASLSSVFFLNQHLFLCTDGCRVSCGVVLAACGVQENEDDAGDD